MPKQKAPPRTWHSEKLGRAIYQRKDGRWCVEIEKPRARGAKRDREAVYDESPEGVERRALELLELWRVIQSHGEIPETVEALCQQHLDTARDRIAPYTWRTYEIMYRLHLIPALGKVRLRDLTVPDLQRFLDQAAKRWAPSTVDHCRRVLSGLFGTMVGKLWLSNPIAHTEVAPIPDEAPVFLSVDQARAFLAATREHKHGPLWALMLLTGLRIAEALGLRWKDVDLEAGSLTVARQLQRLKNAQGVYEWRLTVPKGRGRKARAPRPPRVLALEALGLEMLELERVRQGERRLAAGPDGWRNSGLVFTDAAGHPLWQQLVARELAKIPGLPEGFTLHKLRHSTASMLVALGQDMRVVQEQLRHRDYQLTARTYAHVAPDTLRAAARVLDEALS